MIKLKIRDLLKDELCSKESALKSCHDKYRNTDMKITLPEFDDNQAD